MGKSRSRDEYFEPPDHEYRVPFDGRFTLKKARTEPDGDAPDQLRKKLEKTVEDLDQHQRMLYGENRRSVLCIFQAMDAAGKDSTIRAVTSGINPAGFQVFSFKQPSHEELDHDFLWRSARRLPERGRIGIFNRSYYEEVLVVRVHPEYLGGQRVEIPDDLDDLWKHRFESIREHEHHLARNGTVILKFFLNVSPEEQRERFLARLREPEKQWKFSRGDLDERKLWKDYMHAYEEALNATSRPWAPWYAIPADDKPYMRWSVARILEETFESMDLSYPELADDKRAELAEIQKRLEQDG